MYTRLSGVKWLILNIVTLGIYSFVAWHVMTREQNKMAESVGEKKIMGYIPAQILGFFTFGIYPIVWLVKFFARFSKLNEIKNAGVAPSNGFLMFLMTCIPYYSFFWFAGAHNKLADAYEA